MSATMWVTIVLAAADTVLALWLGAVYLRNHREIRSRFTFGLVLFAVFLVLHNGLLAYHLFTMMPTFSGANETLLLGEMVLQTGALVALLSSTVR